MTKHECIKNRNGYGSPKVLSILSGVFLRLTIPPHRGHSRSKVPKFSIVYDAEDLTQFFTNVSIEEGSAIDVKSSRSDMSHAVSVG